MKMNKKIYSFIVILVVSGMLLTYGIAIGKYEVFPYDTMKKIALKVLVKLKKTNIKYKGLNNSIMDIAFLEELPNLEEIRNPIKNIDELKKYLNEQFINTNDFMDIYEKIEVIEIDKITSDILKISYNIENFVYHAYIYTKWEQNNINSELRACLIIPGSGTDTSSKIFIRDVEEYQYGSMDIAENYGETFVLIKENNDYLSVNNGSKRLDYNFIYTYQINNGSSYSAEYIVDSMAICKYMESEFSSIMVMGISQGGAASFIVSLFVEPDISVVSSGFSTTIYDYECANINQIIIPGIWEKLNLNAVQDIILSQKTEYIFSYGAKERGIYMTEYNDRITEKALSNFKNCSFIYHGSGHSFPVKEIISRIKEIRLKGGD